MFKINLAEDSRFKILLFFVAVVYGLLFILFLNSSSPSISTGDAHQWDGIGWNLAQGKGYSFSTHAPYILTMRREPGYPLLLAIIYKIFGHNLTIVKLLQVFVFGLSGIMTYLIGKEIFNAKIAKMSSLIFVLFPSSANYTTWILRETICTFIFLLIIYFLIKAVRTKKLKYFILISSIFAYALYINFIFIGFIFLFFLWYVFINKKICTIKRFLSVFILVIIVPLLIYMPWPIRNYKVFGTLKASLYSGVFIYARGLKLGYPMRDYIPKFILFNTSERLTEHIYNINLDKYRDLSKHGYFSKERENKVFSDILEQGYSIPTEEDISIYKKVLSDLDQDVYGYVPEKVMYREGLRTMELLRVGYNMTEIDNIKTKEGLTVIIKHPFKFLSQSVLELLNMNFFAIPIFIAAQKDITARFDKFKGGIAILSISRLFFKVISLMVIFFAIKGMFIVWDFKHPTTILVILIAYLNIVYALLSSTVSRFTIPLVPFYLLFCIAGIIKFKKSVLRGKLE